MNRLYKIMNMTKAIHAKMENLPPNLQIEDSDDSVAHPDYLPDSRRNHNVVSNYYKDPTEQQVLLPIIPLPWKIGKTSPLEIESTERPKRGRKIKFGEHNRSERKLRKYKNLPYTNIKNRKVLPKAISLGVCTDELTSRQPGNMSHSRWTTTTNRILCLYIGTMDSSEELQELVDYITKVYAPVWFHIKGQLSCEMGPKHIFKSIQYSRCLSDKVKTVVVPVIQRNAFFAHLENLLLAMITDNRGFVKELGLRRIIKARKELRDKVRVFKVPKPNFNTTDYIEVIHWASKFPCHTQAVEHCVKLVT
ncbi:unnamed protein product [Diabrotica balteata]|uniref:Uncharacterized protein n=1 Tax=Diabrotica balteata TaxID=107213 RepID=A0A9N9XDE9_DIABA|nr:unnamed protein product [Diabrotica balteata]